MRVTRVRVAVVDDHRVVARSLQSYLESFADLQVVGVATSGELLLAQVDTWRPDVVIVDLLMPGGIDGIETVRRLRRLARSVRIVVLTASTDEAHMVGVLRVGADGYVRKGSAPDVLLDAVRAVAAGHSYVDPSASRSVTAGSLDADHLTPRELDVLQELVRGASNKEIANALGIAEETVKSHVGSLLGKLQAGNRAQAIVTALKRGLVAPPD
jgi:DNA-binding NarL/FixJ family response regulator